MKTRIAAITLLVLFAMSFDAGADTTIRVVRLASTLTPFKCGDRCKFRAAVPSSAIRLRIFRGTIANLSKTGTDPRYVGAAGCVEYYSMIVRPRHPRRPANVLDLRFYFMPKWLNGNRDGRFVFVVEHDDRPNGPQVEEHPPTLRLPATDSDEYFRSGVDVTIRAPVYRAIAMERAAMEPAGGSAPLEMVIGGDESASAPTAVPRTRMTTSAGNDCVTVRFDTGDPVIIRRADAGGSGRVIAP